uniref:Cyclin-Q n=1 Tax=Macrostomum lignano TaxID=282301 RepID=A0A1I8G611_9PLAT
MDRQTESYHFKAISVLTEASIKLDLDATTFAGAATLYHRFYKSISIDDVDPHTLLMSCVHLAAKLLDKSVYSRDIINVFYQTLHPDKEPLEGGNNQVYNGLRQSLATCELFLVRAVGFSTELQLPHSHLLYQLSAIADWMPPGALRQSRLPTLAWSVLRDSYHAPLCLSYPPQALSLGVIAVAMRLIGLRLPGEIESRQP